MILDFLTFTELCRKLSYIKLAKERKQMKRILCAVIAVVFILSLGACGNSTAPTNKEIENVTAAPASTAEPAPVPTPEVAPTVAPTSAPTAEPTQEPMQLIIAPHPKMTFWRSYNMEIVNAIEDADQFEANPDYTLTSNDNKLVVVRVKALNSIWLPDFEEAMNEFELRTPDNKDYPLAYIQGHGDPVEILDFVFEIPSKFPVDQCVFLILLGDGGKIINKLSELF